MVDGKQVPVVPKLGPNIPAPTASSKGEGGDDREAERPGRGSRVEFVEGGELDTAGGAHSSKRRPGAVSQADGLQLQRARHGGGGHDGLRDVQGERERKRVVEMGADVGARRLGVGGEHAAALTAWDEQERRREKDRFRVGRKKRFLYELRLAREEVFLVSSVLFPENVKTWDRRRKPHQCDIMEVLVPLLRITERADQWDLIAREPTCDKSGWDLRYRSDRQAYLKFVECSRPEVMFVMPDLAVWGDLTHLGTKAQDAEKHEERRNQKLAVEVVIQAINIISKGYHGNSVFGKPVKSQIWDLDCVQSLADDEGIFIFEGDGCAMVWWATGEGP